MMSKQRLVLLVWVATVAACQSGNPSNTIESTADASNGADVRPLHDGGEGGTPANADAASSVDGGTPGDVAVLIDLGRPLDGQVAHDGMEPKTDAEPDVRDGQVADASPASDAQDAPDGPEETPCPNGSTQPCGPECPGGTVVCEDGAWAACVGPPEACNGIDDDCDGDVDEEFPNLGDACMVGVGACSRAGRLVCNDAGDNIVCDAEAGRSGQETCNGSDDDCDGETDEDFQVGVACEVGAGECRAPGVIACAPDGSATCTGQPAFPSAERCNGVDDNCDGQVDEAFGLGTVCSVGTGLCEARGVRVCGPQGNAICGARTGDPLPEQCNGLDDNCDGQVDETFPMLASRCTVGTGACERAAETICNDAGDGVRCDAVPGAPAPEQCNGLDDDCDGQVDDGFDVGAACTMGVGACQRSGNMACLPNGHTACNAVATLPAFETCNGLDDDCDGLVDEGEGGAAIQESCYNGPAGTLNVGVCRAGTKVCTEGDFGPCEQEVVPSAEVCDRLDNDCSGTADNGIPELGAPCGTGQLGRCSTGHGACSALGAVCTPDFAPGPETCNGIDDDCDGAVDDGTGRGDPCTSGLGECTRNGVLVCAPNGQTTCNAVPGAPAATDTCDGRDDNCDGVVDDGCPVGLALGNPLQGPLVGPGTVQNAYRVFCPGGQVIRGFYVDPDAVYNLDGFIPLCGLLSLNSVPNVVPAAYETVVTPGIDGPTVGSAVNGSSLVCPVGQVITGFSGKTGSYGPNRVTFNCSVVQPLSPGNNYTPHVVLTSATGTTGADGANVFAYDCPRDTVLAGVYGQTYVGSNDIISIGFLCTPLVVVAR